MRRGFLWRVKLTNGEKGTRGVAGSEDVMTAKGGVSRYSILWVADTHNAGSTHKSCRRDTQAIGWIIHETEHNRSLLFHPYPHIPLSLYSDLSSPGPTSRVHHTNTASEALHFCHLSYPVSLSAFLYEWQLPRIIPLFAITFMENMKIVGFWQI